MLVVLIALFTALYVGSSVGGMSLPWLIGQLFELMGPRMVLSTIMAAMMVATGVFGIVMRCSSRPASDGSWGS
ncbi:MAG: hypothetical protein HYZ81_26800 [Nitrospinae bacterium]|nr:hypothetical protein [Nitrospinota bacterium]